MFFLDTVMQRQARDEFQAGIYELLQREPSGATVIHASLVEDIPIMPEVIVLYLVCQCLGPTFCSGTF